MKHARTGVKPLSRVLRGFVACALTAAFAGCPLPGIRIPATENIAQEWNRLMLDAQRQNSPAPTIFARTLWHVSSAMYEAWAAYDETATGYYTGYRLKQPVHARTLANRAETLSHAVYTILRHRFAHFADDPAGSASLAAYEDFEAKMRRHGYIDNDGEPVPSAAQALGVRIAEIVLAYAATDGSNEANGYAPPIPYVPMNDPLVVVDATAEGLYEPNFWQPLQLPNGTVRSFLTPHWGAIAAFALPPHQDDAPRIDPGPPPFLGTDSEDEFIAQFVEVIRLSAALDPASGEGAELVNRSPGAYGNNPLGTNDGTGHAMNPYTGAPYADNSVRYGDWLRAIAEYWADGPNSETPPGHWNTIANDVLSGSGLVSQRAANKAQPRDLEYDVKLYFILNSALHDAAIVSWDLKEHYEFVRPISAIRYLAANNMLPITPGLIETIEPGDPLAGENDENVGRIKIRAWLGPNQGAGWMLGEAWRPYQLPGFVTPPFPGYTSGHSTFSRASAEVLTRYTGDPYFPGGLAIYDVETLHYETGPSEPTELQWAKYFDASDEASQSRLSGGIHVQADDFMGRITGAMVGDVCYEKAIEYFEGRGVAVAKHLLQ